MFCVDELLETGIVAVLASAVPGNELVVYGAPAASNATRLLGKLVNDPNEIPFDKVSVVPPFGNVIAVPASLVI